MVTNYCIPNYIEGLGHKCHEEKKLLPRELRLHPKVGGGYMGIMSHKIECICLYQYVYWPLHPYQTDTGGWSYMWHAKWKKCFPEEDEFTPRSVWIYRECIWLSPQMLGWFVDWCTGVDYQFSTPYTLYIEREMISHIWGVCLSITDTNLAQKWAPRSLWQKLLFIVLLKVIILR